jgi:hypothetical protein
MRIISLVLVCLFLLTGSIPAQLSRAATGSRVDYYDEALRVFGTASSGQSIRENRALEGNRIIYHKNGNLYPDESAVKYFSLRAPSLSMTCWAKRSSLYNLRD